MKVLFIGEDSNDIGSPSDIPGFPRRAGGTVASLARRVSGEVGSDSIALAWSEIHRFSPSARKRGYSGKVAAAVLLAKHKYRCSVTVVFVDRDGRGDRKSILQEAVEHCKATEQHPTACGVAVESVEAWTLGCPDKIAEELGVDPDTVRRLYPSGVHVEALSERSGNVDHRPKQLLARIAQLKRRSDSTEFREAVALRTDVAELVRQCPEGFAPFVDQLRAAFAAVP